MRLAFAPSLAALVLSGCFVTVSGTSRSHLAEAESVLDLPEPPEPAAVRLVEHFARRGIQVVDRAASGEAVLFRFRGGRGALTSIGGGQHTVSSFTEALGSVFYVTLQPHQGGTRAWFFGRPTVQGREPCAPPGATYPCDGLVQATPSAGQMLTGREEAEAIRGVILELSGLKGMAAAPSGVVAPPPDVVLQGRTVQVTPDNYLAASARADFTLRAGPDESAPISAEVRSGQKIWAGTSAMRGFRAVRTLDGKVGYAPDASVQLSP